MGRASVDPVRAQEAVDAVRKGQMSYRTPPDTFGKNITSIYQRLSGKVSMNARVGSATVLSEAEEKTIEEMLI